MFLFYFKKNTAAPPLGKRAAKKSAFKFYGETKGLSSFEFSVVNIKPCCL